MQKEDIKKIKSGGYWTALGAFAGVLSQLLIMLSLAMLLSPSDVGLFSIFLFVLGLGLTVLPFGNDFAFVQAEVLTRKDVFYTILVGLLFATLADIVLAIATRELINLNKNIVTTIRLGVYAGYFESCFLIYSSVSQRRFDYKSSEMFNISRHTLNAFLSISSLIYFDSVFSVFLCRIFSNFLILILFSNYVWKSLKKGPRTKSLIIPLSLDMMITNILGQFSRNSEVLAAGYNLGISNLGQYELGRKIVGQPRDLVGSILFKFTYPIFSNIQKTNEKEINNRIFNTIYKKTIKAVSLISFPIFALSILLSKGFFEHIFGSEWQKSVSVIYVFSSFAFLQVVGNHILTSALVSLGHSRDALKSEAIVILPRYIFVYVASFFGPAMVATAASSSIMLKIILMQVALQRITGLGMRSILVECTSATKATLLGVLITSPIFWLGEGLTKDIIGGILFLGLYIVFVSLLERRILVALKKLLVQMATDLLKTRVGR